MADPEGEARGTRPSPLLLDQTEARRAEKFFFRNVVGLIFGILRYVTCILSYSSSVCKLITLHNILQVKGAAPRNLPKFKK